MQRDHLDPKALARALADAEHHLDESCLPWSRYTDDDKQHLHDLVVVALRTYTNQEGP